MGFRGSKSSLDLSCRHKDCKICFMSESLRKMGIDVSFSWHGKMFPARYGIVPFGFYCLKKKEWYRIPLAFSEIYLVHIWGMYETHGLTALYNVGLTKLSDISLLTRSELLAIPRFGRMSLDEILRIRMALMI